MLCHSDEQILLYTWLLKVSWRDGSPWKERRKKIMLHDSFTELATLAARVYVPLFMPKYAITNINKCIFQICYAYTWVCIHTHPYAHTYIQVYTHTYLYIHTQINVVAVYISKRVSWGAQWMVMERGHSY